jgi:hypothetical protein
MSWNRGIEPTLPFESSPLLVICFAQLVFGFAD